MGKLDTSKIEGYAEMSAEDKIKALEELEIEDNLAEVERYKNANSKANSEIAEQKKKIRELESQLNSGASDSEKKMAELEEQINSLKREKMVTERKASFIGLGMTEDSALKASEAFTNGDSDSFFTEIKSFMTEHDKVFKAELLKTTPKPGSEGGNAPTITLDAFRKLSPAERAKFASEHPDEYKKLYPDR